MSDQKYYITPTGDEIIIREGKAVEPLPLKAPNIIDISGDIKTISNFLKIRKQNADGAQMSDPKKMVVYANKSERKITMKLDPENYFGATVTGTLQNSDELEPFKINREVMFTREQLRKLIRFSKVWFNDKEAHGLLELQMSAISMKTEVEIQAANDHKGNKKTGVDQKVNKPENWIDIFTLFVPIFKGFTSVKVVVEICMDATPAGLIFWLESPTLVELMESSIDDIFSAELASCEGYVIINK